MHLFEPGGEIQRAWIWHSIKTLIWEFYLAFCHSVYLALCKPMSWHSGRFNSTCKDSILTCLVWELDNRRFPNLSIHLLSTVFTNKTRLHQSSIHIIRVKLSSCHTLLVKEAYVCTKCVLVESCDKMTKLCHIFKTFPWPLYLSVI